MCEFIGNVNLFDGLLVEDGEDHAIIACADLEQPIYVGHGISSRAENKKVTYALRPEKLLMSLQKPEEIEHPDFNWTKGEFMTSPIWAAIPCITSSCPRQNRSGFHRQCRTPRQTADLG